MPDASATMFKSWRISRNQKRAAETLVLRTASTMKEQVVSTGGRATRAIVRAQDKRIEESPEEKAVNPRGSSCKLSLWILRLQSRSFHGKSFVGRTCVGGDVCGRCMPGRNVHEIHQSRNRRTAVTSVTSRGNGIEMPWIFQVLAAHFWGEIYEFLPELRFKCVTNYLNCGRLYNSSLCIQNINVTVKYSNVFEKMRKRFRYMY